ncbi:MAG: universal stress protein [Planctomycetota bacterium]
MAKSRVTNILVLVDGTESSFHAADYAIDLAHMLGARITAMAVVDTDTLRQLLNVNILVDSEMAELQSELQQSAQNHLDEVCQRAMAKRVKFEEVLRSGNSEVVVPKELSQRGVDLLAMGAFPSARVKHDLLARQRQQILDRTTCPILVVK